MCTVTFVSYRDTYILTSSRDEKNTRGKALSPAVWESSSGKLLFPADSNAGGSWFIAHENGNAAVLLNGADIPHLSNPPYLKSRGLVLMEIMQEKFPESYFREIMLEGIEPFTIVLVQQGELWHCQWNGRERSLFLLPFDQPNIWSSVTLYDSAVHLRRVEWFNDWLSIHPQPAREDMIQFHLTGGVGDTSIDIRMDRPGLVSTVSITALVSGNGKMEMSYLDLSADKTTINTLFHTPSPSTPQ